MNRIVIFAIGGKITGVGNFIGVVTNLREVGWMMDKAKRLGANRIELHGMGLAGECSFINAFPVCRAAGLL